MTSADVKHAGIIALIVLFGLAFVLTMIDKALGRPVREFPAFASLTVALLLFVYLITPFGSH